MSAINKSRIKSNLLWFSLAALLGTAGLNIHAYNKTKNVLDDMIEREMAARLKYKINYTGLILDYAKSVSNSVTPLHYWYNYGAKLAAEKYIREYEPKINV